jgi:hypothetical protein
MFASSIRPFLSSLITDKNAVVTSCVILSCSLNANSHSIHYRPMLTTCVTLTLGKIFGNYIDYMALPQMKPIIAAGFYSLAVYHAVSNAIKFLVSPVKENHPKHNIQDSSRISYSTHYVLDDNYPSVDIITPLTVDSVMEILESSDSTLIHQSKNIIKRILESEPSLSALSGILLHGPREGYLRINGPNSVGNADPKIISIRV